MMTLTTLKMMLWRTIKQTQYAFVRMSLAVIPTMGDGSCFFHALLEATSVHYRALPERSSERSLMATRVRNDIADSLGRVDPSTGLRLYDTIGGGILAEMSQVQVGSISYTLAGLERLLRNPHQCVGDEVFLIAAHYFNVRIYFVRTRGDHFELIDSVGDRGPVVVLHGTGYHYELVALNEGGRIIRTFALDHSFLDRFKGGRRVSHTSRRTNLVAPNLHKRATLARRRA